MKGSKIKILSIDTSCDETAASVTENLTVLSNIIWSQASLHARWGGVVPSIAQREHKKRIDWVVKKALSVAMVEIKNLNAIAVTVGPGLAIALEVGIIKAKEISKKFDLPFVPVNHIEGHLLSPLAVSKNQKPEVNISKVSFPALGIVASGGHTEVILIKDIGNYQIIAKTLDDALGESLDKAARLLKFGYPGGAILEKIAKGGSPEKYPLPIPMVGREKEMNLSYSGLKTAFFRTLSQMQKGDKKLSKNTVSDLASSFQLTAFKHFIRVLEYILKTNKISLENILAGGGVMANTTLRKMLRKVSKKYGVKILFPYSKKLYTDNAAMIGIAAYFKYKRGDFISPKNLDKIERLPRSMVDKLFSWN